MGFSLLAKCTVQGTFTGQKLFRVNQIIDLGLSSRATSVGFFRVRVQVNSSKPIMINVDDSAEYSAHILHYT